MVLDIYVLEGNTDIDRDGQVISRFVGLPESYIFPRGYIFQMRAALRENINLTAPPKRDISLSWSIFVIIHGQHDGLTVPNYHREV